MGTQQHSLVRIQIGLAFSGFLLIGLMAGAWGVLLPGVSDFYRVNKAVIGLLFFGSATGYFLSALCSGFLAQKLGLRWYLIIGTVAFLLGNLMLFLKPPFLLVLVTRVLMGIGVAIIDTGLNIFIASLPNNASYLNYLHAFFGVGALIGPVIASVLLNAQWSWSTTFALWGAGTLLLLIGFILFFRQQPGGRSGEASGRPTGSHPTIHERGEGSEYGRGDGSSSPVAHLGENGLLALLKLPIVWLATLYLLVYCGVETNLGNWGYTFLLEQHHEPDLLAGWIVSGYWMGLTLGRFVFNNVAERLRIGISGMMYCAAGGSLLGLLMLALLPGVVADVFSFGLIGFCLGPIFPTTVALVPRLVPARIVASTIGFLIGVSTLGIAIFPWFAGVLAQYSSIWSLLPYTAILALIMVGFWIGMARKIRASSEAATGDPQGRTLPYTAGSTGDVG